MSDRGPPRAMLIDLDDTILDDSGAVDACWREACSSAAANLPVGPDTVLAAIEKQRDRFWSDAHLHRQGRLGLRAATRRIVREAFSELGLDHDSIAFVLANQY